MFRLLLVLALVTSCDGSSDAKGKEINLKEGNWEVTSEISMPGSPIKVPPVKGEQCITKKSLIPQSKAQDSNCKMLENKVEGDTVVWKMECNSEGMKMVGEGSITYNGETFEGSVKTLLNGMTMTTKMSGKRIGKCK